MLPAKFQIDLHPDGMTRDEIYTAKAIIDNLLESLTGVELNKAGEGKPVPYEQAMFEVLMVEWGKASKKAVQLAVKKLAAGSGKLTKTEMKKIMAIIEKELAVNFPEAVNGQLTPLFDKAYRKAKRGVFSKLNLLIDWDKIDDGYIAWLNENNMYWVGNYYDRILSDKINEIVAAGLAQGLGREAVGKELKGFFTHYPGIGNKPDAYWRGLAANGMNRARNFGLLKAYEEIGVTHLEVVAVMDKRTSDICREMNGRIIPLAPALAQRDLLVAADNPEDVKTISPWLSIDQIKGKSTGSIISNGMIMPPYHFNCRTTVIEKVSKSLSKNTFTIVMAYPENVTTPLDQLKYRARERIIQREVA